MKVLTFGEILLRLTAPGYSRLFQKGNLDATFCGAEANVAVSLVNYGVYTQFLTKLPKNDIGLAAANSVRYFGVDISKILYGDGRMGTYYLERGASQRPSRIWYDRQYSALALAKQEEFKWDALLDGVQWFHWTGINPALSEELISICIDACKAAKSKNISVSCDLNFRNNLWSPEEAKASMEKLMPYVDVCIANEEDADKMLGISNKGTQIEKDKFEKVGYQMVAQEICNKYGCSYVATSLRNSITASDNGWEGVLYCSDENKSYYSKNYSIHIVDRVGSGDSFAAGIIYGLINNMNCQEIIEFATAASCLKHSIEGDYNRVTVQEVKELVNGSGNGRVKR